MNTETQKKRVEERLSEIGYSKDGLIYELFVEKFLEEYSIVRKGKQYYLFSGIFWEELSQEELYKSLKNFLDLREKYHWKSGYATELIHFLNLKVDKVEEMDSYRYIMPFKDFDFNFRTGEVEEKEKTRNFTYCKNMTFEEINSQECPIFNKFMDEISQNDDGFKRYLLQVMGLVLSGENRLNLVFIMFGEGANSKSLILKLLSHLIGTKFVASRKIETFTENFGLDGLETAKLITCGESETLKPVRLETIKAITGNDVVEVTGKYKDIKSRALSLNMIFSTNRLFKILDDSDGVRRRLHNIPLKYQVPVEKRDPELFDKLAVEEAGILRTIIAAYTELINEEGKLVFEMSSNVREFTEKYFETYLVGTDRSINEKAEQVLEYVGSFEKGNSTDRIGKKEFYDVYCHEIEDISVELFWKIATPALDKRGIVIKKNGKRFLEGIKPSPEYMDSFRVNYTNSTQIFRRVPPIVCSSENEEESFC